MTASLILEVRGDLFILVEEVLVEVVVEGSPEIWMMLTVTYVMQKGHLSYDCPEKQKTDKDVKQKPKSDSFN